MSSVADLMPVNSGPTLLLLRPTMEEMGEEGKLVLWVELPVLEEECRYTALESRDKRVWSM